MSHTYTCLMAHLIFSTKDRRRFIDDELALRLHPYLGGIARDQECTALAIGGVEDHVHLLISYPAKLAVANLVRDLKANSSKWIHDTFSHRESFAWQPGYAAFSVSMSVKPAVCDYIGNQVEHHQRQSLYEEVAALLAKHGGVMEEFDWWKE
jgi:putative transposase